jgi:hypothetical protein
MAHRRNNGRPRPQKNFNPDPEQQAQSKRSRRPQRTGPPPPKNFPPVPLQSGFGYGPLEATPDYLKGVPPPVLPPSQPAPPSPPSVHSRPPVPQQAPPPPAPAPVYPDPRLAYLPTGVQKQCRNLLFVDIDNIRHVFECEIEELQNQHPNQPHMAKLEAAEPGDEIFLGWWHAAE